MEPASGADDVPGLNRTHKAVITMHSCQYSRCPVGKTLAVIKRSGPEQVKVKKQMNSL